MLFLDLDGTLLHVRARHYAVYVEVLAMPDLRGVPIPEKDYWGRREEGKPIDEILKDSRLFPPKFKLFKERFDARLETPEMLTLDKVREGTETALGKLHTKTPIVLVTQRGDEKALAQQLAQLGLAKYFVTVLAGRPPPSRRPTADDRWRHKAELVKKRYRILPTETLYVGDTENDVKCARALGFEVWLVEGGHRKKDLQMKADPDRIVADLSAGLKYMLPGGRWQR